MRFCKVPRQIEYIGEVVTISDYEDSHRYDNQINFVDGIPLNPSLRSDFDMTPNEYREQLEINDWWNKPFIVTQETPSETWEEYDTRLSGYAGIDAGSKAEFEERATSIRDSWLAAWPSGIRYEVRCLNGGAWDRSSSIGMLATMEAAVETAKKYKPVDYSMLYVGSGISIPHESIDN
jgi:hypothetical protein